LAHAEQDVTRWEAAQHIYVKLIRDAVEQKQPLLLPDAVAEAFKQFAQADIDPALKALVLTPPTVEEMAEYYPTEIPLDAIFDTVQELRRQLANKLFAGSTKVSDTREVAAYELTGDDIANRSWLHTSLYYLASQQPEQY